MLERAIGLKDYGRPQYLHADVFAAFCEVLPWPPGS
jgi:hypothetical protein